MTLPDPVFAEIEKMRLNLLFENGFWGHLILGLKPVQADWLEYKTMATDGIHIFFDRDFFLSLGRQERTFGWMHEIMHCLENHVGAIGKSRFGHLDPQLVNEAQDFRINHYLKRQGIGKMPSFCLFNEDLTYELSTEEVINKLQTTHKHLRGKTFDQHLEEEDIPPEYRKGVGGLNEYDQEKIRDKWRMVIQNAKIHCGGNIPHGMNFFLPEYVEPKINWKQLLASTLQSMIKDTYNYIKVAKRAIAISNRNKILGLLGILPVASGQQVRLPTLKNNVAVDALCGIDVSGSIGDDDRAVFLSEVRSIMRTFKKFKITVLIFDTDVKKVGVFDDNNINEIDDFARTLTGGGGTLFGCVWDYIKEHSLKPERIIFFTDGYPNNNYWGDPNGPQTLWILKNNDPKLVAPFGKSVHYGP